MSMYDQPTSYRNRRPSFSSGPSFGASQGCPPHNDFRRDGFSDRGQFGDPYSGFSEVSGRPGPPPIPPRMPSGPPPHLPPPPPPPLLSLPPPHHSRSHPPPP